VVVEIKPVEAPRRVASQPEVGNAGLEWMTDYQQALARAKVERRNVFLFFTGSDWCEWCHRLEKEILTTAEFRDYAKEKLLLVTLDFPKQTPQSEAQRNQNLALAEQYRISGYPTVIILNPTGRLVKRLGYQEGGPGPFIETLRSLER
jgi:thioredoxin-related protein